MALQSVDQVCRGSKLNAPSPKVTGACFVRRRAFTLVELLVVIGIIAVLIAMLLPALRRAKENAQRTVCASNMHQWANALGAYVVDNRGFYPYNMDGEHVSWIGATMIHFSERYLTAQKGFGSGSTAMGDSMHVLYCPTADYYRESQLTWGGFSGQQLIGYYYFPHRRVPGLSMDYTPAGNGWVTKKKPYGVDRYAPILGDIKTRNIAGQWQGYSNHQSRGGIAPAGGNFMFEDGHVRWFDNSEIALGGVNTGAWEFYYKIPLD